MSAPARPAPLAAHVVGVLPVAAGMGVHALAHARWFLVAPLMLVLAVGVLRRWNWRHTDTRLTLVALAGAALGFLVSAVSEPPVGPFPPSVLGPMCGTVLLSAVFCALSDRVLYASIFAWVLAALSGIVEPTAPILAAEGVLAISTLLAASVQSGAWRQGWSAALGFAVTVAVVVPSGLGVMTLLRANEGRLVTMVYNIVKELGLPTGLGFDPEMTLNVRSNIMPTMRRLMELEGDRPARLRTVVMDSFDGNSWRTSSQLAQERHLPPRANVPLEQRRVVGLMALEELGPFVPSPGGTDAVEGAETRLDAGNVLRGRAPPGGTVRLWFEMQERIAPEPGPGESQVLVPERLKEELPPLLEAILGEERRPRILAQRLERYLHDEFEYTLNTDLSGKGHPLTVLLREKRPAYCAYFASAMAVGLRLRGVPARVVGGFIPEEKDLFTGRMVVRERDAHAWVEAYLEDQGRWVAFDPTPDRGRDEALQRSEGRGLLAAFFNSIKGWLVRMYLEFRHAPDQWMLRLLSSPLSWLVGLALLLWQVSKRWKLRRARRPRPAMPAGNAGVHKVYGRYLKLLRRHASLAPGPAETDDELVHRLRHAAGEGAGAAATDFLVSYRELRYRGVASAEPSCATALEALERTLREKRAP